MDDQEQIAINEIQDLRIISPSLRSPRTINHHKNHNNNNNHHHLNHNDHIDHSIHNNGNNIIKKSQKQQLDIITCEEDLQDFITPSSPTKKFKSLSDDNEVNSNRNNNNNKNLTQSSFLSVFNKSNNSFEILNKKQQQIQQPQQESLNSLFSINNNNNNNNKMNDNINNMNRKDQVVINIENGDSDTDSEYDDESDEENENEFTSEFEEMKNHPSTTSNSPPKIKLQILNNRQQVHDSSNILSSSSSTTTPTIKSSPKPNPGTPSRPFPTLDYKIKSESVKQNPDGTYSCPYITCNKTIKGNKGNLSSHLRWHRRLDSEAGELGDSNSLDQDKEEFTTPIKPSQRGVQLRNQMIRYGLNLFRQDSQGKYLCFFDGCNLRMLTNFSRHVAKHERRNDRIKSELVGLIATSPQSSNNIRYSHFNPSSPTTNHSLNNPTIFIGGYLPNTVVTPTCQSTSPFLPSSPSPIIYSPNNIDQSKIKSQIIMSAPNSPQPNYGLGNTTNLNEPCTPTFPSYNNKSNVSFNQYSQSLPSSPSHHLHRHQMKDCSNGMISIINSENKAKGKVDPIVITGDNNLTSPSSPQSIFLSPKHQNEFSTVPNSPTSPLKNSRYMNASLTSSPIIFNLMNSNDDNTFNNLLPIPNTLSNNKNNNNDMMIDSKDILVIDNNSNNNEDKENNNNIYTPKYPPKYDIQWEFRKVPFSNTKTHSCPPSSPSTNSPPSSSSLSYSPSSPFQPSIVPYSPIIIKKNKYEEEFVAKSLLDLSYVIHNDSDS